MRRAILLLVLLCGCGRVPSGGMESGDPAVIAEIEKQNGKFALFRSYAEAERLLAEFHARGGKAPSQSAAPNTIRSDRGYIIDARGDTLATLTIDRDSFTIKMSRIGR